MGRYESAIYTIIPSKVYIVSLSHLIRTIIVVGPCDLTILASSFAEENLQIMEHLQRGLE